jgi:hypothetical protein
MNADLRARRSVIHPAFFVRGLPQSAGLLRNDEQDVFINRSAATKLSSWMDCHALVPSTGGQAPKTIWSDSSRLESEEFAT